MIIIMIKNIIIIIIIIHIIIIIIIIISYVDSDCQYHHDFYQSIAAAHCAGLVSEVCVVCNMP